MYLLLIYIILLQHLINTTPLSFINDYHITPTNNTIHTINTINNNIGIGMIIFKLPRSGSSWLTQCLNNIPNVFISKEIIQRKDILDFQELEIEQFLLQALSSPKGKLKYKDIPILDYRYQNDFYFHQTKKWLHLKNLNYIGFSLNPEHIIQKNLNWSMILYSSVSSIDTSNKRIMYPRIIIYIRKNVVKTAISGK